MNKKLASLWEGTYPLIIYTFLASALIGILNNYTGLDNISGMLVEICAKVLCILAMIYFLRRAPKMQAKTKHKLKDAVLIVLLAVLFNIAFNNIISLTPLKEWSENYQTVENFIFSEELYLQIVCVVIVAPLTEEIVFRGILQGNYRAAIGRWPAIIASAIIFGIMHNNLVQFVYAFLLGVFFAYLYDWTGELWTCILAHIAANLYSLTASHTGIAQWMFSSVTICLITGIAALIAGIVMIVTWKKL